MGDENRKIWFNATILVNFTLIINNFCNLIFCSFIFIFAAMYNAKCCINYSLFVFLFNYTHVWIDKVFLLFCDCFARVCPFCVILTNTQKIIFAWEIVHVCAFVAFARTIFLFVKNGCTQPSSFSARFSLSQSVH